jgi:hypothetical protein
LCLAGTTLQCVSVLQLTTAQQTSWELKVNEFYWPYVYFWLVSFHGGDYEECRLLEYKKNQFVPHRKHIASPLKCPAG